MLIPVVPGSDNIETFQAFAPNGSPYLLDNVTRVDVEICSERAALSCGVLAISSLNADPITWDASYMSIRFGDLSPYRGTYYPKIIAFDADNPDGVVIAGKGYSTEIQLQVDC